MSLSLSTISLVPTFPLIDVTMQVEGDWRVAANLYLLLGSEHPPARVEKPLLTPQERAHGCPSIVRVEARNTANFRSSSYCGLQDKSTLTVRKNVVAYYRDMLQRIQLWHSTVNKKETAYADQSPIVKPEPRDDDGEAEEEGEKAVVDDLSPSAHTPSTAVSTPLFRAVGILTQVQETSTASTAAAQQAPWEFYVVCDLDDDGCYVRALQAMTEQSTTTGPFMLLQETNNDNNNSSARGRLCDKASVANVGAAGEETTSTKAAADEEAAAQDGTRLSLYTRQVSQFTGLYPGMAVGIIGEPFQRTARGVLTGVLVRDFVLPARPMLPWRVDRPLPSSAVIATSYPHSSESGGGARIHFCSGPFPRRDVAGLLRTVTQQALHRGADVLIIGGPFIPPFTNEFERGLLPSLGATFNEMLDTFVDTLEETLKNYYATRPLLPHMKVLLVSHRGDVTQVPVLPTTMYAIADTEDILVRSNPCRLSVNGVHVSVCNEDVVGAMRERMVERWPTAEGSLRRVVEALVDGRLYTPLYHFPVTSIDMKHLPQLRMDYVPPRNELLDIEPTTTTASATATTVAVSAHGGATQKRLRGDNDDEDTNNGGDRTVQSSSARSWDALLQLTFRGRSNSNGDAALKSKVKQTKAEPKEEEEEEEERSGAAHLSRAALSVSAQVDGSRNGNGSTSSSNGPGGSVVKLESSLTAAVVSNEEFMPHIMFLPSTRPHFAVVTHQSEEVDGPDLDNTASATGVLVVNQEVWSTRSSPKFQLRVAEVTIPNTELVLHRGATAANGVTCGVLHIYAA